MKNISYKERSYFYDNEYIKEKYVCSYLKHLKKRYQFTSSICCPCGTGIYFKEFSRYFKLNYFVDINCEMIKKLVEKLEKNKIDNITSLVCDMRKIKTLEINVDFFISLNQGIQFLNLNEFKNFLSNIKETANYIVLDLFDFSIDGKLKYYDSHFDDNVEYFSKDIKYNNKILKRYNIHHHQKDYVTIDYKYMDKNGIVFTSQIKLFNYPYEVINDIILKEKIYKVIEIRKYKQGNYILLLKRSEDFESENR